MMPQFCACSSYRLSHRCAIFFIMHINTNKVVSKKNHPTFWLPSNKVSIEEMKSGKSEGVDNIPAEIIKGLE